MPWGSSALALHPLSSKCYSLWVSALIFKQAQGGAGLLLKAQSVRLTQVPKATMADLTDATPQTWLCGVAWNRCRWASSGLETRLPSHEVLYTMASLASDLRQGRLQGPTAQENTSSDLGCPQEQNPQCKSKGVVCLLRVCCPMSPLTQLHLVWEKKQTTYLSLQPFPRNYLHFCSPNQNNTLPTDTTCKTKPYLSWDLRTHTELPAGLPTGQPQAGLLEAPPWLMATSQEKQGSCGDNLTLVKFQRTKSILQIYIG